MKNVKRFFTICAMTAALTMGSITAAGTPGSVWMAQAESTPVALGKAGADHTPAALDKAGADSTTVTSATPAPTLNKTAAILIKGQTLQLNLTNADGKVTWSSSDKTIASVGTKGKVTAKKKGTATITARNGGKKYTCKITVETPKLNKTALTIAEGKTYKLKLSGTTQTVKWFSSDRAVATVGSTTGKVRGVKAGECTITAKIGKKKYSCQVKVTGETIEQEQKPDQAQTTEKDSETLTEQQVYAAILAMQSEYPEGKAWTNDDTYYWKGGIYSGGMGCAAFAFAMSDAAFGSLPARMHTDYSNIRVGDILRINHDTHSVIVLEVSDTELVIAEGNYNDSIHWGRKLDRTELPGEGDYILTRYPE